MDTTLHIYDLQINTTDPDTGMWCISLVDQPAVDSMFLKFNQDNKFNMQFTDEEKHIVTGIALRADYPIYRNNDTYGEHYVRFTKDTIRQLVEKYAKLNLYNTVNLQHNDNNYVNGGIYMIESYFIDRQRGICPDEFKDIEDGSWVISYKVNDLDLWNNIKTGYFNGFSIEGVFTYNENKEHDQTFNEFVDEIYKEIQK